MVYKLEQQILIDGMRQQYGTVAHSGLCGGQSSGIAFIEAPVIADINNARSLETINLNRGHGLNRAADYLIARSDLNLAHAASRDNAGHLALNDNAAAAAFHAVHSELFKAWHGLPADNHRVTVIISGAGAVSINAPVLFADTGWNFSFAAADAADGACGLALAQDCAQAGIVITVNGMAGRKTAARLDAANAVRRFHVDAEISVTRPNVNLLDGHAGTGNDGRNIANNFALNHAAAGKKSAGGVSFLNTKAPGHREIHFYHAGQGGQGGQGGKTFYLFPFIFCLSILSPVFKNSNHHIFKAITLRCANVSA